MAKAYGSITLVDINDFGQLSVIPESNYGNAVVYDPDTDAYSPDWTETSLELNPIIQYGGRILEAGKLQYGETVTVVWQKKVNGTASDIVVGNGVELEGWKLKVSVLPFTTNAPTVSYICKVSYGNTVLMGEHRLEAMGQMSFNLSKNASAPRQAEIIGENAFLFDGTGACISNKNIVLTPQLKNLTFNKWQYQHPTEGWKDIGQGVDSKTGQLTISHDSTYFEGKDLLVVQLLTKDGGADGLTDIHSIHKLRDGAPGDKLFNASLTNDSVSVPITVVDEVETQNLNNCATTLHIFKGSEDITDQFIVRYKPDTAWIERPEEINVEGKWDEATYTYIPTKILDTTSVARVVFHCDPKQNDDDESKPFLTKTFSLTPIRSGQDGKTPDIYSLELSSVVLNKNIDNFLSPQKITLSAKKQTGEEITDYTSGKFSIKCYKQDKTEITGTGFVPTTSAPYDLDFEDFQYAASLSYIEVKLYDAENNLLDSQTITVVTDGKKGDPGNPGDAAVSFLLSSYYQEIPCTNDGFVSAATTIRVSFSAWQGTQRVECAATPTAGIGTSLGITKGEYSDATTEQDGWIEFTFDKSSALGGTNVDSGSIKIKLTASTKTNGNPTQSSTSQTFNWKKGRAPLDGDSPRLLQIIPEGGDVLSNGEGSITLKASLLEGAEPLTSGVYYQWLKYVKDPGTEEYSYVAVDGNAGVASESNTSFVVTGELVETQASFQCIAQVGASGPKYYAEQTIRDIVDDLQISLKSTLGDKLVNSLGCGMLYPIVYRGEEQLDKLKTESYGADLPASAKEGDYFYWLDKENRVVVLKQRKSDAWVDAENELVCDYDWTQTNADGSIDKHEDNPQILYIDASVVNKKAVFDLEVKIKS